jgi:hypothetical protein
MKKEWYLKCLVVVLVLTSCLLVVDGCKEADDKAVIITELISEKEPLQANRAEKGIETITLNQAMSWHETHENKVSDATTTSAQEKAPQHLCLGVAVGYQAIRYTVDELFPESIPQASDFDIKVSGPMDGVWDIMSLYTGRDLKFESEPKKLDVESFTFTAKRISKGKSLVFRLRQGMIPRAFFTLKNQGKTCGNPDVRKVKQQALLNILSVEPKDCFRIVDAKTS